MNFKRKQRIQGRSAKTYKEWYDETRQYRISWRSEVFDVTVAPGFYACVRAVRDPYGREEYWGFASRRGLYKTLKAAQGACELSLKLWNAFLAIEGRAKVTQVRNLVARSMIGKKESAYSGMSDLPLWVCEKATPRLLDILQPRGKIQEEEEEEDECPSLSDPIRVWRNSDETSWKSPESDGLALNVVETEKTSSSDSLPVPAQPAKGRAKVRKKQSKKRTAKKSKRGKKKSKRTTKKSKR
jgi:hypothetical protein